METPLNNLNYLNAAAFVLSWALNSEVDMGPDLEFFRFLDGMREFGRRYESMVTPAETTFLIAHFVLLFQGIFAVTQMLPKYRGSAMVQVRLDHAQTKSYSIKTHMTNSTFSLLSVHEIQGWSKPLVLCLCRSSTNLEY